jgi:quinol monooxygenase YgiN
MSIGPFTSLWTFDRQDLTNWLAQAEAVIRTLQSKSGFLSADISRSPDTASRLIVSTRWVDVGSYRRAMSSTEAKMLVWPFLADMHDMPSAFEVLLSAECANVSHYQSSLES